MAADGFAATAVIPTAMLCPIGVLLAFSPFTPLPRMNALENGKIAEQLTECVVIIALWVRD